MNWNWSISGHSAAKLIGPPASRMRSNTCDPTSATFALHSQQAPVSTRPRAKPRNSQKRQRHERIAELLAVLDRHRAGDVVLELANSARNEQCSEDCVEPPHLRKQVKQHRAILDHKRAVWQGRCARKRQPFGDATIGEEPRKQGKDKAAAAVTPPSTTNSAIFV